MAVTVLVSDRHSIHGQGPLARSIGIGGASVAVQLGRLDAAAAATT